jgi:hypothetical protein
MAIAEIDGTKVSERLNYETCFIVTVSGFVRSTIESKSTENIGRVTISLVLKFPKSGRVPPKALGL